MAGDEIDEIQVEEEETASGHRDCDNGVRRCRQERSKEAMGLPEALERSACHAVRARLWYGSPSYDIDGGIKLDPTSRATRNSNFVSPDCIYNNINGVS